MQELRYKRSSWRNLMRKCFQREIIDAQKSHSNVTGMSDDFFQN